MVFQTGKPILSLQQFILRQEVKKLYREIFRTIRRVPGESHQNELKEWARRDFRSNLNVTDDITIRMHINYGKRCLKELQNSLDLSG
ncbi:LYR motif-containing protein 2 [Coccinella septempunctata]|uniref:LYR motif-containing protein 2 n=1 Tax=Coccinella septempunctata TaxID=41139 RepID=UPI001D098D45|nr:LYR motif-containing protein 2 [Coccinella septempunctata]